MMRTKGTMDPYHRINLSNFLPVLEYFINYISSMYGSPFSHLLYTETLIWTLFSSKDYALCLVFLLWMNGSSFNSSFAKLSHDHLLVVDLLSFLNVCLLMSDLQSHFPVIWTFVIILHTSREITHLSHSCTQKHNKMYPKCSMKPLLRWAIPFILRCIFCILWNAIFLFFVL